MILISSSDLPKEGYILDHDVSFNGEKYSHIMYICDGLVRPINGVIQSGVAEEPYRYEYDEGEWRTLDGMEYTVDEYLNIVMGDNTQLFILNEYELLNQVVMERL